MQDIADQETTQEMRTCFQLTRFVRNAVVINYVQAQCQSIPRAERVIIVLQACYRIHTMIFVVNRSAPLMTIITKPTGNSNAPNILISPGALS